MCRFFPAILLAAAFVFASPADYVYAGEDEGLAESISLQWKKYREQMKRYQFRMNGSSENYRTGEKSRDRHVEEYKQQGNWRLVSYEFGDQGSCWGVNGRYAFELSKVKNGWMLSEIDTDLSNGVQIAWIKEFMTDDFKLACGPHSLGGHGSLHKLLKRPGFSVTKKEAIKTPDGELAKVWFTVIPDEVSASFSGAHNVDGQGWLLLDPNCYWRILEMELPFRTVPHTLMAKYQYEMADKNYPLLRQLDYTYVSQTDRKPLFRNVKTFEYEKRSPSEDEFKLSAFGLPEPTFPDRPAWWRSYPYLWLSVGAALCFALAFWLRRQKNPGT